MLLPYVFINKLFFFFWLHLLEVLLNIILLLTIKASLFCKQSVIFFLEKEISYILQSVRKEIVASQKSVFWLTRIFIIKRWADSSVRCFRNRLVFLFRLLLYLILFYFLSIFTFNWLLIHLISILYFQNLQNLIKNSEKPLVIFCNIFILGNYKQNIFLDIVFFYLLFFLIITG